MANYKNVTFNPLVINADGRIYRVNAFGYVDLPDGFVKAHPMYKEVLVKSDNAQKVDKLTQQKPKANNEPPASLKDADKKVKEIGVEAELKLKS